MFKLPKYKRRRLISDLMKSYRVPSARMDNEGLFTLKGNSEAFSSRLNSVFDGLKQLEQRHEEWNQQEKTRNDDNLQKSDPVEEAEPEAFRKPMATAPRKRKLPESNVPSFCRHPSKWTKYSLADVSEGDMSDKSNAQAAFDCLQHLRKRRLESGDPVTSDDSRPVYLKPAPETANARVIAASGGNAKFVMPECVVGGRRDPKPVRNRARLDDIPVASSRIRLEHLDDVDEESDGADDIENSATVQGVDCECTYKGSRRKFINRRVAEEDAPVSNTMDVD